MGGVILDMPMSWGVMKSMSRLWYSSWLAWVRGRRWEEEEEEEEFEEEEEEEGVAGEGEVAMGEWREPNWEEREERRPCMVRTTVYYWGQLVEDGLGLALVQVLAESNTRTESRH